MEEQDMTRETEDLAIEQASSDKEVTLTPPKSISKKKGLIRTASPEGLSHRVTRSQSRTLSKKSGKNRAESSISHGNNRLSKAASVSTSVKSRHTSPSKAKVLKRKEIVPQSEVAEKSIVLCISVPYVLYCLFVLAQASKLKRRTATDTLQRLRAPLEPPQEQYPTPPESLTPSALASKAPTISTKKQPVATGSSRWYNSVLRRTIINNTDVRKANQAS